jgi:hypothetical protein
MIGRYIWCVRSSCRLRPVALRMLPRRWTVRVPAPPVAFTVQHLVTAANACCCQAPNRCVRSLEGACPVTSDELVSLWSCVRLGSYLRAWTLFGFYGLLIMLLGSCLSCWSSYHHVAFIHVTFATYWTTKLTIANTLVQFGLVDHQTPKSKVNGPRVHFPHNVKYCWASPFSSFAHFWNTRSASRIFTPFPCVSCICHV